MPTIYIENAKNAGRPKRCVNQIQTVVDEIKKTINMTVQNTLNTLEVDWNRSAHFDQIEPYRIFGENELLE